MKKIASNPARRADATGPAASAAGAALRRARILQALDALGECERLVLALEMCDGLAVSEIAAILELTPRAIARRREHALTAIRRAVAGRAPVPAPVIAAVRSAL